MILFSILQDIVYEGAQDTSKIALSLNYIQTIVSIISTLTVGGVIGSIVGIKYKARLEKGKAGQENAKADNMEINNVNEVIKLYKQALLDFKELKAKDDAKYIEKLDELNAKISDLEGKLTNYKDELSQKESVIADLTRSTLKLKLELDQIKNSSTENCASCSFKATCEKYKAKQLKNE